MSGLLRKDLYAVGRTMGLLLLIALLLSLDPGLWGFGMAYAAIMASSIAQTTISSDEKSRWDRYAAMLPLTPGQIVGSKYLLCGLFILCGAAAGGLILLIQVLRGNAGALETGPDLLAGMLLLPALLFAVSTPAIYRLGAEKGRLVTPLLTGAAVVVLIAAANVWSGGVLWTVLPAAAAILAVPASFRLSVRLYIRRRDGAYG